jgi:hypothetical protein
MGILAGEQQLEDEAEREHVARRRQRFTARLLRTHEERRAEGDADGGGEKITRRFGLGWSLVE